MKPYLTAWHAKMIQIWQDRLDLLAIHDTGALRQSLHAGPTTISDTSATLTYQFLQYGIYVDRGTGNGYRHGNGGNLQFLGRAHRALHHMGRPREKRPWFSHSWYISTEVLKDHLAHILGDQFIAAFDTLGDDAS